MILKSVSATYGRKVNLGDYNSQHVEITLWADLEEGDNPELAVGGLRQMARNQVMGELARIDAKLAAKVEKVFMGLPVAVREQMESE